MREVLLPEGHHWFDLLLYIQGKLRSFGGSVILTTLFLGKPPGGRLPVLSAHSFAIDNCFF